MSRKIDDGLVDLILGLAFIVLLAFLAWCFR